MKIEKVSDHQIRCTLTKADLAARELKISELAYGTEKAKNLFRDMMQQASQKFGFEAEDIPLMIEAIPMSADCIVLIITKVEDPEELDTRFSKFAPSLKEDGQENDELIPELGEGSDEVLDLFKRIHEGRLAGIAAASSESQKQTDSPSSAHPEKRTEQKAADSFRTFSFASLHEVIRLAHVVSSFYDGRNSFYKDENNNRYLLVLSEYAVSPEDFNRICNIASEYGKFEKTTSTSEAYFKEHYELILTDRALQTLATL